MAIVYAHLNPAYSWIGKADLLNLKDRVEGFPVDRFKSSYPHQLMLGGARREVSLAEPIKQTEILSLKQKHRV